METKSQELIRQIKSAKDRGKITYNQIMDELTGENGVPIVSYTTLRRVCRAGSEVKANSFSYEDTLIPIAQAVKRLAGDPDEMENTIKRLQEELKQITAIKEQLTADVIALNEQLRENDKLIKRLMQRLDTKDDIIQQLIFDLKKT